VTENAPERRDEARFMMTLCLYGLGRDQEARAAAASFQLDFPESPRLSDMMLWLGKFDFNRGRYAEARRFFLDYAARWPTSRWADAALVWAARAAFAANDFTGTIELVTRMVRAHPQSVRLPEALLVQADALMELARYDEAVLLLDQVISQAAASEWARLALLRKGDGLFAMGAGNSTRYREALVAYRQMLAQNSQTPSVTLQLHFKVGRCLEKLKQIDDAIDQYYAEVIIRFLTSARAGPGLTSIAAAFLFAPVLRLRNFMNRRVAPSRRSASCSGWCSRACRVRMKRVSVSSGCAGKGLETHEHDGTGRTGLLADYRSRHCGGRCFFRAAVAFAAGADRLQRFSQGRVQRFGERSYRRGHDDLRGDARSGGGRDADRDPSHARIS
jgi:TolA-binding protein